MEDRKCSKWTKISFVLVILASPFHLNNLLFFLIKQNKINIASSFLWGTAVSRATTDIFESKKQNKNSLGKFCVANKTYQ